MSRDALSSLIRSCSSSNPSVSPFLRIFALFSSSLIFSFDQSWPESFSQHLGEFAVFHQLQSEPLSLPWNRCHSFRPSETELVQCRLS